MNNTYRLDSESTRWWWPQAAVGSAAAALIAVILVVPATGADAPEDVTRPETRIAPASPGQDRPCFLTRAQWNVALDHHQPRCGLLRIADRDQGAGSLRPGLGSLP